MSAPPCSSAAFTLPPSHLALSNRRHTPASKTPTRKPSARRFHNFSTTLVASHHDPHPFPSPSVSRRTLLLSTAATAIAAALHTSTPTVASVIAAESSMVQYNLPDLPYAYDGLQPRISADIMRAHHDVHFAGYTNNLNSALSSLPAKLRPKVADVPELHNLLSRLSQVSDQALRNKLRNNGGGYLNHAAFFDSMSPRPRALQSGRFMDAIGKDFGDMQRLKDRVLKEAATLFGSGFVWLVAERASGRLQVKQYANQDNPAMDGGDFVGLLPCDCWEHAWYLQYGPKKADYFNAWWELIDWPVIDGIYNSI